MRTEVQLLVDDLVFRHETDIRSLFSTRRTFVNKELAALYDVSAPQASDVAFVPTELPESGARAGVLSLGAVLTLNAHPTETSPTLRGKYLRERVLCQLVPPPPGNINLDLTKMEGQPHAAGATEEHRKTPLVTAATRSWTRLAFCLKTSTRLAHSAPWRRVCRSARRATSRGIAYSNAERACSPARVGPAGGALFGSASVSSCVGSTRRRRDDPVIVNLTSQFADSGYRFRELLVALLKKRRIPVRAR